MKLPQHDKKGPYLSPSQVHLWYRSKRDYIRKYFFGEEKEDVGYLAFGKEIGEAIEKNDFSAYTPKEQEFLATIPRHDIFEKEIFVPFEGFYLKGFIDTCTTNLDTILDYKTGPEKKITEYEKPEYIQVMTYAMGIKHETGTLPKKGGVGLIERLGNPYKGEELKLGEDWWPIDLPITEERVKFTKDYVVQAAKDISAAYEAFLKINV